MGGDLDRAPEGKSATFLVAALRDQMSGNLDRIQIVKGWMDADGELQEKVYDVAWADAEARKPDADEKPPPVGNTVDVENATWTNPDFDAAQSAFYYARVLEIPTPRWTAYDAKRFAVTMDDTVPMTVTERAYTSPIWHTPAQ